MALISAAVGGRTCRKEPTQRKRVSLAAPEVELEEEGGREMVKVNEPHRQR